MRTLSALNASSIELKLPEHAVTLYDLKTLDVDIKRGEESSMKRIHDDFEKGYINDVIINAFLWRITISTKGKTFVNSHWSSTLAQPYNSKTHDRKIAKLKAETWDNVQFILLPIYVKHKKHWQLGVIKLSVECIEFAS